MAGKSILQRLFDTMQRSIDDDVNCELTPRQCKELLERKEALEIAAALFTEEIKRLNRLLELERSDE